MSQTAIRIPQPLKYTVKLYITSSYSRAKPPTWPCPSLKVDQAMKIKLIQQ